MEPDRLDEPPRCVVNWLPGPADVRPGAIALARSLVLDQLVGTIEERKVAFAETLIDAHRAGLLPQVLHELVNTTVSLAFVATADEGEAAPDDAAALL